MELKEFLSALKELERKYNKTPCEYCGCSHHVHFITREAPRIDEDFSFDACYEWKQDIIRERKALMASFGLENFLSSGHPI